MWQPDSLMVITTVARHVKLCMEVNHKGSSIFCMKYNCTCHQLQVSVTVQNVEVISDKINVTGFCFSENYTHKQFDNWHQGHFMQWAKCVASVGAYLSSK